MFKTKKSSQLVKKQMFAWKLGKGVMFFPAQEKGKNALQEKGISKVLYFSKKIISHLNQHCTVKKVLRLSLTTQKSN